MKSLHFAYLSAISIITFQIGTDASEAETAIYAQILDDYEVLARPVLDESTPVAVSIGLTLQQILNISKILIEDERNQIMETNIWMTFRWTDYRLTWDPNKFNMVEMVHLPAENIWKPDILLYNSVSVSFDSTFASNVLVWSNGTVQWLPPAVVRSTCRIDIRWFPFDEQKCGLKYGSWSYSIRFLTLELGEIITSTFTENGVWNLVGIYGSQNTLMYACCKDPYNDVVFTIYVQRRSLYYFVNFILPCLMISIMTMLSFLLPPDSDQKLTLGITIFVSLCVFLLMVAEAVPPTADAVPLLGAYFSSIMIIVSISQLVSVGVLNIHHRSPRTHVVMSPFTRKLFLHWLPWILRMKRPGYSFYRTRVDKEPNWITSTHQQSENILRQGKRSFELPISSASTVETSGNQVWVQVSAPEHRPKCCLTEMRPAVYPIICLLEEINKTSRVIMNSMQRRLELIYIKEDWKFAAMVVDRICLILLLTILIFTTVGIIFGAPATSFPVSTG